MSTYLDHILSSHRTAAAADHRPIDDLLAGARTSSIELRGFRSAIEAASAGGRLAVIAEIKRRSPSKGDIALHLVASELAEAYQAGGATCLSVLTEWEFFNGSPRDLAAARAATSLPVLRKDFTVNMADVCDARLMGADAVLLIVSALSPGLLGGLFRLAADLGLDALVEVHDEAELDTALSIGATLIGVNQRDLVTFEVDNDRAKRLADRIPDGVVKVAESGVSGTDDARRLADAGYHAILVGESLVRAPDPAAAVAALLKR